MAWLADNFPSLAKLVSVVVGSGGSRNRQSRRTFPEADLTMAGDAPATEPDATTVPDTTVPEVTASIVEPISQGEGSLPVEQAPTGGYTPDGAPAAELPRRPLLQQQPYRQPEMPAFRTESTDMARMYGTWVELEDTIEAAQAELQALLINRKNSEAMRVEAEQLMEQAEAAWEEARRLGEAARKAFEQGFTVNLPGFTNRLRMIKEIDDARATSSKLRRTANGEAWEEANRSRQRATEELLKALTSVAVAASQVNRELREAGNLPKAAESLLTSALEDLRCAQVVGDEMADLGREAFGLLSANQVTGEVVSQETLGPQALSSPSELQRGTETSGEVAPLLVREAATASSTSINEQSETVTPTDDPEALQWQPPSPSEEEPSLTAPTPVEASPMSAAEELQKEMEALRPLLATNDTPESVGPAAPSEPAVTPDWSPVTSTPPPAAPVPAAPPSAAQELERELEAMRGLMASPETTNVPPAPRIIEAASPSATPGQPEPVIASAPDATPAVPVQPPAGPVPESYSGRVYLMFPAALGQDDVETVWEVLDEVAGSGAIVDNRLISREAGIQFTLELGSKVLVVADLKQRMPGAGLTALEEGRLKVDWPRPR